MVMRTPEEIIEAIEKALTNEATSFPEKLIDLIVFYGESREGLINAEKASDPLTAYKYGMIHYALFTKLKEISEHG